MVDLPTIPNRLVTVQAPRTSVSAGEIEAPFRLLADNLNRAGEVAQDVSVKLANQEGEAAVSSDGKTITPSVIPIVGPASAEFARAARFTALSKMTPDIESSMTKLRLQYPNDPEGFKAAADAWTKTYVDGDDKKPGITDPALKGPVERTARNQASAGYRSLLEQTNQTNVTNMKTSVTAQISDISNRMADLAFTGGVDSPEYRQAQQNLGALYGELGSDARLGYPKARIDSEVTQLVSQHKTMAIAGNAVRMMDGENPNGRADAKKWLIDKIYNDPSLNLSMTQRHSAVTTAMGLMEARSSENKALIDGNKAMTTTLLTQLRTASPYNPITVNDALSNAAKIGDAESYYKLTFARGMHDWDQTVRSLPLPQQMAALRSLSETRTPFESRLIGSESSGNPTRVNQLGYAGLYQFGAPRLADMGIYTPGAGENLKNWSTSAGDAPGKWSGTFNVPGFPEVKTMTDFLRNPAAQRAAYGVHQGKMDQEIASLGLDKYEGQTIGGVTINRQALYGMMHLGGAQGTANALASGGVNAARDANGTSVMDYARKFGRGNDAGQVWFDQARLEQVGRTREYLKTSATDYVSTAEKMLNKTGDIPDNILRSINDVITETGQDDLRKRMNIALMAHYGVKELDSLPENVRQSWASQSLRGGTNNFAAANQALKLTPQEQALYARHLKNLNGPGGVDNADGTRSTLFQTSVDFDGKTYNIPTVWDGKILKPSEAVKRAAAEGWDKFPSYGSPEEAESRYQKMHDYIAKDTPAGRASVESPIAFQVHEHMVETIKANAKGMQETPYSTYAARTGGKPPPVFDFSNPDNVAAVSSSRAATGATIRNNDLTAPKSVFEGQEADAFATSLTNGDPAVAARSLGSLASLPEDVYRATLASKPVAEAVSGMMSSREPARMTAAMGAADKLWRANPAEAQTALGGAAITKLQAWQALQGSFNSAELAERLNASDDPSTVKAREVAKEAAEKETSTLTPGDMAYKMGTSMGIPIVSRVANVVTGATPNVPFDSIKGSEMVADYRATYTALRTYGVDADKASDLAVKRLGSTWGISATAGNQLMRNPPERFYPAVDGGHDWMQADVKAWVEKRAGPQVTRDGRGIETGAFAGTTQNWSVAGMIADGQTQAEIAAGKPPSYQVAIKKADGTLDIIAGRIGFDPSEHIQNFGAKLEQRRQSVHFLNNGQYGNAMPLP